jgi:hypothetical protein
MTEPTTREVVKTDKPPGGLPIGRLVLGGLLVLVGVLWLLDATGVTDLRWQVVLPAALTIVGVALMVSARRGAHGGLLAAGIVLSVLVLLTSLTPFTVPVGGVGDRVERPATAAQAEQDQSLAIGSFRLDLRDVEDFADGDTVTASLGIGELVVRLPDGVGAEIEASAGIGEVTVVDRSRGGFGVSLTERAAGSPTIVLEVSVGIGRVEVIQ